MSSVWLLIAVLHGPAGNELHLLETYESEVACEKAVTFITSLELSIKLFCAKEQRSRWQI